MGESEAFASPFLPPERVYATEIRAARDEALSKNWSVREYKKIVDRENGQHLQRVTKAIEMWKGAGGSLSTVGGELSTRVQDLQNDWNDDVYRRDFAVPVIDYAGRLNAIGQALSDGPHIKALEELTRRIPETQTRVQPYIDALQPLLDHLASIYIPSETDLRFTGDEPSFQQLARANIEAAWAAIRELELNDQMSFQVIQDLDGYYTTAANALDTAAQGHVIDGPAAAQPPTGSNQGPNVPGGPGGPALGPSGAPPGGPAGAPPGSPGGAPPGGAPPGGAPPGGAPPGGAPPGGAPPGGAPPGGAPPGGGPGGETPPDTGLAGAPPTTIPPPTIPEVPGPSPSSPNLPGSTSPGGPGPLGGVGGGPIAAGLGGASRPGTGGGGGGPTTPPDVQQAARNLSSPQGAGNGQAPSLSGLSRGSSMAGAGTGLGGIPPMMPPPMMPGMGGDGNGKPKPGTAQPTGPGRTRPAGGAAGVPAGLRGRTGGNDGQRRAAAGRARREQDQQNPNAELLDSELWEVDQPKPASPVSERRRVREY